MDPPRDEVQIIGAGGDLGCPYRVYFYAATNEVEVGDEDHDPTTCIWYAEHTNDGRSFADGFFAALQLFGWRSGGGDPGGNDDDDDGGDPEFYDEPSGGQGQDIEKPAPPRRRFRLRDLFQSLTSSN